MAHASLSSNFVMPEMLRPVRSMDPYKPCWCGSGKSYKFCHFRRDRQTPVSPFKVAKAMLERRKRGLCSYSPVPGTTCMHAVTEAHTVQKRGALAAIAEAGHVLDFKPASLDAMIKHQGMPPPRPVGIRRASTFPGFCNEHDAIFGPIEGRTAVFNQQTALLFAFRAAALERHMKEAELAGISDNREMDKGLSFEKQVELQQLLHVRELGVKCGLADVEGWKTEYEGRLRSGDIGDIRFLAVTFDRVLPVAACGAFSPEFDLHGSALQRLGRSAEAPEHVTMNVAVFEDRTSVVFAWLGSVDGPAAVFVGSFASLPESRMADAVIRVTLEYMENVYVRPSWWAGLEPSAQAKLMAAVWNIAGGHIPDGLVDKGTSHATADVISVVSA